MRPTLTNVSRMRWLAVTLLLFSFGSSGCLVLDAPDGELQCSEVPKRACPQGYYCLMPDRRCWRDGHFPADLAMPSTFPDGPEDMSIPVGDDLMSVGGDLLQSD